MDKRKAIEAYRSGLITAQQCAQILGLEKPELLGLVPGDAPSRLQGQETPEAWEEAAADRRDPALETHP